MHGTSDIGEQRGLETAASLFDLYPTLRIVEYAFPVDGRREGRLHIRGRDMPSNILLDPDEVFKRWKWDVNYYENA